MLDVIISAMICVRYNYFGNYKIKMLVTPLLVRTLFNFFFCLNTFSQVKTPILKSLFQRSIFVFSPIQAYIPRRFNHYIGYRFPLAGNFYTHPCMHERIFAFFPSNDFFSDHFEACGFQSEVFISLF